MKAWYLIYTNPKQEKIAIENLANQGYTAYCPTAQLKNKQEVLFPRYVFVNLDNKKQDWTPIRSTKGVMNFVRFGLEFAKVPHNLVEALMCDESTIMDKLLNLNRFKKGDVVRINKGVLSGQNATFYDYDGDSRVMVLIKLLQQEQIVSLDGQSIRSF